MVEHCELSNEKPCVFKNFILPTIVVTAAMMGFEYIFHSNIMQPFYAATAELWRTPEEMELYLHINILRSVVVSTMLVVLYHYFCKHSACGGKSITSGIRFGAVVGLIFGFNDFGAFAWLPIPIDLAIYWLIGGVLMGMLLGVVLSVLRCLTCGQSCEPKATASGD